MKHNTGLARVVSATAQTAQMSIAEMRARSRRRPLVVTRQIGMLAARRLTAASLPEIARAFGLVDHTTAMHGIRRAEQLVQTSPTAAARLASICDLCRHLPEPTTAQGSRESSARDAA